MKKGIIALQDALFHYSLQNSTYLFRGSNYSGLAIQQIINTRCNLSLSLSIMKDVTIKGHGKVKGKLKSKSQIIYARRLFAVLRVHPRDFSDSIKTNSTSRKQGGGSCSVL